MKFLSKYSTSEIYMEGLRYLENRAEKNAVLKDLLLIEQRNFCAYTEKYITAIDSVEVEHLDSKIKFLDDYYNYYATLRRANLYKKDEKYFGASFLMNLFFQNQKHFDNRIKYVKGDYAYEEIDDTDQEAIDFIDFLGMNEYGIYTERKKHIDRLKAIFNDAKYNDEQKVNYFRLHNNELNYITVIEQEFSIDLSEFYT